jgi:hypothetical protein
MAVLSTVEPGTAAGIEAGYVEYHSGFAPGGCESPRSDPAIVAAADRYRAPT